MPNLKLTDQFGLVIDAQLAPESALSKYLKNPGALLALLRNAKPITQVPLSDDPFGEQSVGFSFREPVHLGNTGVELTIEANVIGAISIIKGESLFNADTDAFRDSIPIPADHAYVGAAINAELDVALAEKIGDLQFGFKPGTTTAITNYRLFRLSDPIIPAIQSMFAQFGIPGDLQDIEHFAEREVVTLEGAGSLTFAAQANLLAAVNPLATLNTGLVPITVAQGAAMTVKGTYTLTGGYQLRIERLSGGKFRLGFQKRRSSEFDVAVEAHIRAEAGAGGFDLIKSLLQAVSGDPVPDKDVFHQAGLTDEQIGSIAAAVKVGIERSLALSMAGELDVLDSSSAAFSYEIDADLLDMTGKQAVHDALDGDLTGLEALDHTGITRRKSVFETLRQGKRILRVNLLGIFNSGSVTTLFQKGVTIVDRETGDVTITDQAGASRIEFTAQNFAKDSARLRRVLAESLLITAAYRCSPALSAALHLSSHYWFFEMRQKTNVQDITDYLNIAQALRVLSPKSANNKLATIAGISAFGRSTLFIEASYSNELCKRMFLDANGHARADDEYETMGRKALALLLPNEDPVNTARRLPLFNDGIWKKMKAAGQPGFPALFGPMNFNANQIADIISDYTLITWWASSMSRMADALEQILDFVANNPGVDHQNNTFKKLRGKLENSMASIASNTKAQFGEPWGILALDLASDQRAETTVRLISPRLVFVATERTQ